jgi:hypothetical protein
MNITFNQRFGVGNIKSIENDFPKKARIALMYILEEFVNEHTIKNNESSIDGWIYIYREILRISGDEYTIIDRQYFSSESVNEKLLKLEWYHVFNLCERIYGTLLSTHEFYGMDKEITYVIDIQEIRNRFSTEISNLLSEDNMPYIFDKGVFVRPGKIQTQKNVNKATAILARPELNKAKYHFNKALEFFSSTEKPDFENTVKEALCSLEITIEIKSTIKVSKDFSKEILKLSGSENDKIPAPIIGAMIKIFGYRGSAEGVAHGIQKGLRVSANEAELVLSIIAAFITYIVGFYDSIEQDIPF